MTVNFSVIIPARYAATRLPGKPLLTIGDKPLIQHVYEQACKSAAEKVIIATDSEKIARATKRFGADTVMTSLTHESGTDRLAEAAALLDIADDEIVVNVQGDEFDLPLSLIDQVATGLANNPAASVATLCEPILSETEYRNPNIVKLVRDKQGMALYFSRAPLPASRDNCLPRTCYRHIGLYAYRRHYLCEFSQRSVCELELSEALEQLRILYHADKIFVDVAQSGGGIGIDTEEDLERARQHYQD